VRLLEDEEVIPPGAAQPDRHADAGEAAADDEDVRWRWRATPDRQRQATPGERRSVLGTDSLRSGQRLAIRTANRSRRCGRDRWSGGGAGMDTAGRPFRGRR
jgi:hypothetical protein